MSSVRVFRPSVNARPMPSAPARKRKPTLAEKKAARKAADAAAAGVGEELGRMTPAQKLAELERLEAVIAEYAPTAESVRGDLHRMLLVVGALFVERYYPDADYATFHFSRYDKDRRGRASGPPEYSASIPVPVPGPRPRTREELRQALRDQFLGTDDGRQAIADVWAEMDLSPEERKFLERMGAEGATAAEPPTATGPEDATA